MKKKLIFYTILVIAIGTLFAAAVQHPAVTLADEKIEVIQFLPIVKRAFAPAIAPFVSDIVPPSIVTDIVDPGDGRLFIATRDGRIQVSSPDGKLQPDYLLDIRDKVLDDGNESGLVGLAAHPEFATNGAIYVFYVETVGADFYAVVAQYTVDTDGKADAASEQRILHFELPTLRHHGGAMHFGPHDGHLYIAIGDGGIAEDRSGNAQSTQTLLGKILRIDVDGDTPYVIPEDNPFAAEGNSRGEIWALGLRNPWRFSFDRDTGDMYIGDVGENSWEEINFIPADSQGGENFGWSCREGPDEFYSGNCKDLENYIDPIYAYPQNECAAVIGGYVYRGTHLPELAGQYLFSDVCDGVLWSLEQIEDHVWEPHNWGYLGQRYTTFGQRFDGELLLGAYDRTIYQLVRPGAVEQ